MHYTLCIAKHCPARFTHSPIGLKRLPYLAVRHDAGGCGAPFVTSPELPLCSSFDQAGEPVVRQPEGDHLRGKQTHGDAGRGGWKCPADRCGFTGQINGPVCGILTGAGEAERLDLPVHTFLSCEIKQLADT